MRVTQKSIQLRVLLHGAAAIAQDGSTKIQRYYGGYPADNGGGALQRVIRNIKSEKFFFFALGHAIDVSVFEQHEDIYPQLLLAREALLDHFKRDVLWQG